MRMQSTLKTFAALAAVVTANLFAPASAFELFDPFPPKTVWEFYNVQLHHYLLLSDPAEVNSVEQGGAGPGWTKTGYTFDARNEAQSPPNICRFYAPAPTNSHFFTGNPQECDFLRNNSTGWLFEKLDFSMQVPVNGACPAPLLPIYRLYNNRARFGDTNHRYVHDAAARDEMLAAGWVDEGVAFCTTGARRQHNLRFTVFTQQVRPSAECENEALNIGPCVATNQMPRFANRIASWVPPNYVTKDPLYSERYTQVTGFDGDVYTAQPVADTAAVASHSFAQTLTISRQTFGIHVSHLDRTAGTLASINPLYQFATLPGMETLPWLHLREGEIVVSFDLDIRTIRRLNADSHAYGHPTLQFKDMKSGQHLYVTLGAFGTGTNGRAPEGGVGMDTGTGRVIVGTAITANPFFGRHIAGEFLPCEADATQGSCGPGGKTHFAFGIRRADFTRVLGLARTRNPGLSAEPSDYLLANFHFNSEIYREAELGLTLSNYELTTFGY